MATISRFSRGRRASARLRLTGFIAWLLWLVVHLIYLTGFKNRVTTLLHWSVSFLGRGRSERATTTQQVFARTAMQRLEQLEEEHGHPAQTAAPSAATGPAAAADGATAVDPVAESQRAS